MAKKKNPNRVKAGKKAWAKMKREGRGLAGMTKKKSNPGGGSTGSKRGPKRPSLSKLAIAGGIVAITTAVGEKAAGSLIGQLNVLSDEMGLGMAVTGATVVLVTVGLKGFGSIFPWFGRKYRAFLSGYGLRP
jgi:hypothetical protein